MLIIADANIPFAQEAFAQFGEVRLLPGREMSASDLAEADALIVRSVTMVNEALLKGSPVRFVGTATIGTDHLDIEYLTRNQITWASAAGCNARSVVEWVVAALAELCVSRGEDWAGKTLGIVGRGNVGSRLEPVARALGMKVLVNDPPLARAGTPGEFVSPDEVLDQSDFVSLHVPLIREGEDRTHKLITARELAMMKPGAVLINSCRGSVVDNKDALETDITLIFDVFEGEPRPNQDLVRKCFLATPHIAGYSYEGKVNGTRMMADALAAFLNTRSAWKPDLPPPANPVVELQTGEKMQVVRDAIRASYDIRADDAQMREGLSLNDEAWGKYFDALRKSYPKRREFANYRITGGDSPACELLIRALGFGG